jgi:serine/threonine protein phosphatase PrpC
MSHQQKPPLVAAAATDVGRVRDHNEDACLADPSHGLFIVSDGIGGHQAGDLASRIVVSVLPAMIEQHLSQAKARNGDAIRRCLCGAVADLSRHLRAESAGRIGLSGMGATVVAMLIRARSAHIVHMGDSRAYRLRGGKLEQLTEDHSVTGILLRAGEITTVEAKDHPAKGRLSRFVGMEGDVAPDVRTMPLRTGDRFLLCSDGLTGMVPDEDIASVLLANEEPTVACGALIDAANQSGGRDNIAVIVVNWKKRMNA